jgi:hypothetical protein
VHDWSYETCVYSNKVNAFKKSSFREETHHFLFLAGPKREKEGEQDRK